MRWFGTPWPHPRWRAPICEDDAMRVEVPVGQLCLLCREPVTEFDAGVVMPYVKGDGSYELVAEHIECQFSNTSGHSVGHCTCTHPDLSTRQIAQLAWAETMQGAWREIKAEILLEAQKPPAEPPPADDQVDFDHVFVPKPYTKTCWYQLERGGRCEHLEGSSVHRGTEWYEKARS